MLLCHVGPDPVNKSTKIFVIEHIDTNICYKYSLQEKWLNNKN